MTHFETYSPRMACACCGKPIFTHLESANVQIGNTPTTVIVTPYSDDYRVDVLIEGRSVSWNPSGNKSTATSVTYSFALTPAYFSGDNAQGFTPFTAAQKEGVRSFLSFANSILNINFTEVTEDTSATTPYGQMRMANVTTDAAGYAQLPGADGPEPGDVFISTSTIDSTYAPGSFDYDTLIHEVAHAIGLKHPGNYNAGGPPSTEPGNYLASSEDSKLISVVSYAEHPQGLQRIDFGPYDLLALDYLYGLRPYKTDNTAYAYSDTVGQQLQTIYDTGGIDTLDFSQVSTPTTINLNGGSSSSVGKISSDASSERAQNNIQIAFGTEIERVIGSPQADQITGNGGANILTGGGGNDQINGGGATDIANFQLARSNYTVSISGTSITVTSRSGSEGVDTLTGIERLQFSDTSLALDLDGNAGKVAKILGTIFGPSSVSNKTYVGIGLGLMDDGMSYEALAALAVSVTGKSSSADVCTLLWTNVIGSAPTTADIAPFKAMLDSGQMSIGGLAALAADTSFNTTNIDLVGLSQTGLEYV
jgi:serralysin